ncbi:AmmeMemoRadiSam system protein B [Candidatus Riflebacteria bacterium]
MGNFLRLLLFLPAFFLIFPTGCTSADSSDWDTVKDPLLAGSWYSANAKKLTRNIELYLKRCGDLKSPIIPVGLISPHAGHVYSGQAAAYAYKCLSGKDIKQVIVLGVCHGYPLQGASILKAKAFRTPLGDIPIDRHACKKLLENELFQTSKAAFAREHSIEIQLPFLQVVLKKGYRIVPILLGHLSGEDYQKMGAAIKKIMHDKSVVVASSDFTHFGSRFGYNPFSSDLPENIRNLDMGAINPILKRDFPTYQKYLQKTRATICGRVPIGLLLQIVAEKVRGKLLRYYRSADLTGEWNGSVSYASIVFYADEAGDEKDSGSFLFKNSEKEIMENKKLSLKEQKQLLQLARTTLKSYVKAKKAPDPATLEMKVSDALKRKYGLFVTLNMHKRLRGCIGIIKGVDPLYKAVIRSTINSSSFDHRFSPVTPAELNDIHIEISVLTPLQPVRDPYDIVIGWDGIVLTKNDRQALFLPQVAINYSWGLEETLQHLCRKAGLANDAWKEGAQFQVFQAQIFSEDIF